MMIPLGTEYRTNFDGHYYVAQFKRWWWPFWRTIKDSPKIKRNVEFGWCYNEEIAIEVCEEYAIRTRKSGNGTYLGFYE